MTRATEEALKDADEIVASPDYHGCAPIFATLIAELAAKLREREELILILHDRGDELQDWWAEERYKLDILQIQYEHLTGKELDKHEWKALHEEWKAQIESFEGLELTPPKKETEDGINDR